MARYKQGINGAFSGKVGAVVGASWLGIDYIRSAANTSKVKWSDAQVNHRILFALVMNWIKPVLPVINIGYQAFKKRKTPLNAALGYHLKEAVKGDAPAYEIDFSKAIFSVGELMGSRLKELAVLENGMLHIVWDRVAETAYSRGDDRATFVVYNPDKKQFVTFVHKTLRAELEVLLQLPEAFSGDKLHCYMFYTNALGNMVSTSQYLLHFD